MGEIVVTKKNVLALTLGMLFITFNAMATTFRTMPLEKLIEESSSGAEVELKSKKTFMNKTGLIMTEFTFGILDSYALETSDLDGEFLKLTMAGGTLDGVTSYIEGAPEFQVGEKSFLLLKKIESKIYLSNFTMGKYKIENVEGQSYYVSSVFPADQELGRVKKEKMVELMKSKFKITDTPAEIPMANQKMVDVKEVVVASARVPANEKEQDEFEERSAPDGVVAMWSFFSLFMLSGATIWWKLKKGMSV
jgi:hypothetical protein